MKNLLRRLFNRGSYHSRERPTLSLELGTLEQLPGPDSAMKIPEWLAKFHEPLFHSRKEVEEYVTHELGTIVPQGWSISKPRGGDLTWIIDRMDPGHSNAEDYCLRVPSSLDLVILTYGNTSAGPFCLHHALQKAFVIEAVMLRRFSLTECLSFLFANCEPNQRCAT